MTQMPESSWLFILILEKKIHASSYNTSTDLLLILRRNPAGLSRCGARTASSQIWSHLNGHLRSRSGYPIKGKFFSVEILHRELSRLRELENRIGWRDDSDLDETTVFWSWV